MKPKLKVICCECRRAFQTTNPAPECPRCGGTDIEARTDTGARI